MGVHENENSDQFLAFYIFYTLAYFPLLVCSYLWTKGLDSMGKYNFQLFLLATIIAESLKNFVANFLFQKKSISIGKKNDSGILNFTLKSFQWMRLKEGVKIILFVALMTLFYYVIAVLFGAEVLDKCEETLMFSSLLSVLTVFPMSINVGYNLVLLSFLGLKPASKLQDLLTQNLFFTLAGAWMGAIPIPLDWDRPWQKWPITCCLGAILGYMVSHVVMRLRLSNGLNKKHIL